MIDPFFRDEPLDTERASDARYSQHVRAEVMDALTEAQAIWKAFVGSPDETAPGFDRDELLACLWRRGYKVVPIDEAAHG